MTAKYENALTLKQMQSLPILDTLHVSVPIENPAYQEFLISNSELEQARETFGYVPQEYRDRLTKAAAAVDLEAKKILVGDRSHP